MNQMLQMAPLIALALAVFALGVIGARWSMSWTASLLRPGVSAWTPAVFSLLAWLAVYLVIAALLGLDDGRIIGAGDEALIFALMHAAGLWLRSLRRDS